MNTAITFVALCVLAAFATCTVVQTSPQPMFAWSSTQTTDTAEQRLASIQPSMAFDRCVALEENPELLVVFLVDKMTTDHLTVEQNPTLHTIAQRAGTVSYPYVFATTQTSHLGVVVAERVGALQRKQNSLVVLAGHYKQDLARVDGERIELSKLVSYLKQNNQLFSNGVTDVVVVSVSSPAEADQVIGQVDELLTASKSSFVAVVASDFSVPSPVELNFDHVQRAKREIIKKKTGDDTYTSRWPGPVVQGLLVGAVLLLMALIGFIAAFDIQVPERYEKPIKRDAQ